MGRTDWAALVFTGARMMRQYPWPKPVLWWKKERLPKRPKNRKKKPSKEHRLRLQLLSLKAQCHYCGCPLDENTATLDHVIPQSKGGPTHIKNLVLACPTCNNSKGSKWPEKKTCGMCYSFTLTKPQRSKGECVAYLPNPLRGILQEPCERFYLKRA